MDASLRNTPALVARIEKLRDELIRRFAGMVSLAGVEKTDRNTTALTQYQMQVETSALIRTAQDVQSLTRQLREMWLFGQLNTMGDRKIQQQTDEDAKAVAGLLKQLTTMQQGASNGEAVQTAEVGQVNGTND